jgi:class 3 adenylate cyclase/predicted ATPase
MRCPSCDHDNRADRRFCAECGTALAAALCRACGASNEPGEKFCGGCGERLQIPVPPSVAMDAGEPEAALPTGERRQLTVLFCDMVGSTELAGRMDPEDWQEITAQYQRCAAGAVVRFGGHVAKYLGDGLLVLFGYPHALGDDAERAVRAGLAIVEAVAALDRQLESRRGVRLAVRVGMHTGPVVVGPGADDAPDVFGETPNIAARIQTLAESNGVLISAATHRLTAGLFVVEERGAQTLKGVRESVFLYRVRQSSGVRGRLAAAAGRGLTPFVGREHERRLLLDRWEQVREGNGQVVVMIGEAGIGKSRLVQVMKEDLAAEPHTWIECTGSPYDQNTPFFAVVDMLQQGLGWRDATSAEERLEGLHRALDGAGLNSAEAVPLVAPLLGLAVLGRYPPLLLSPEGQRRKLLATLVRWLFAATSLQPLVAVLEDLHWVDPSTLELQSLLVDQAATAPVLLVYTTRPEFRAFWPLRSHHTHLTLKRLGRGQVREMVSAVAASTALPAQVLDAVIARTDGVPLFVEELTKAMVETTQGGAAAREVPATLQDSLMARLDRLGAVKEVAQIGAVIGREFPYSLLHAISPLPEVELQAALDRLLDAELLYVRGLPPDATYLFKHALVQETAYGSLLKSRRRELHRVVARMLEEQFTQLADTRPELLGHHYTGAGDSAAAVVAWQRAGEEALRGSAHAEAAAHFGRGLEALGSLPETPERVQHELLLQIRRGQALQASSGYGSAAVAATFARARELGSQLADSPEFLFVLLGLWTSTLGQAELDGAQELAGQLLALAERDHSPATQQWAHLAVGITYHLCGQKALGHEHLQRVLLHYRETDNTFAPQDPAVTALGFAALNRWEFGFADTARACIDEAATLATKLQKAFEHVWVLNFSITLDVLLRDPQSVVEDTEQILALSARDSFPMFAAAAQIYRGWALAELGQVEEGIAQLRQGIAAQLDGGQRLSHSFYRGLLAQAQMRSGDFVEALATVEDGFAAASAEMGYLPELFRLRAELRTRLGAPAHAVEADYRDAIDRARRYEIKTLELRSATSFSCWLQQTGRAAEARALLAPIYDSFTEGFDTRDLVEAKTLLEELSSC